MKTNISSLKANLSKYLHAARAGKTVVVTDRKVPIAKVVPFAEALDDAAKLTMTSPGEQKLSSIRWAKIHVTGATRRFLDERE